MRTEERRLAWSQEKNQGRIKEETPKVLKASEEGKGEKTRSRLEPSYMFNDDGCVTVITIIIGGIECGEQDALAKVDGKIYTHTSYNHGIHFRANTPSDRKREIERERG